MADAEVIKKDDDSKPDSKDESTQQKEKIAFLEAESKKAFAKRDEYKKQLEDIQLKDEEEKGKFKELYEKFKTESETKGKALEDAETKLKQFIETQKKELVESLDDESKKFAETLELDQLREFVKISLSKKKLDATHPSLRPTKPVGRAKTFSEWKSQYS